MSMTPLAARLAAPATLLFLLLLAAPASATNFNCATVGKTCQSAIGYAVPNATTYGELAARFNTTTTLAELLGANGLPSTTPASKALAANATVRVPFRCRCGSYGVGQSDGGPVYVVYPLDGLDHIARDVFGAFVTYQEIAAANNIPNPNQIQVGQKLRIPLPCTCDQVDGADVMHFAYSVAKGEDTPGIAAKFGVTESTLLNLNKITDPKTLQQGQILDVPLPVCQSSIRNTSADYNLLVPNGTYVLTAGDCIKCSCSASNYEHLDCSPVQGRGCPAVQTCPGGLALGQSNGTDCASRMCAYTGYTNTTSLAIQTNLVPVNETACQNVDECAHPETYSCYGICVNVPGTFDCRCPQGTNGDPFRKGGCITNSLSGSYIALIVSGGFILLLAALSAPFITRKIQLQRVKRMRQKYFKQNHGLLLQKTDIGERMIITLREIEKATDNFDKTREVGGGGHGIVYKGILNLDVVAIKKSKIAVQREIDDFINEVAILSQVNHRNVVKLMGCCLETEVPLLVYEFISNGTLYHHLHVEGPVSLSWDNRLRIVLEVARALSYLHSAASMPIYHRDIKSSNILLDDNLTAKVSDFGASRYIPIDQIGITTAIQGTIGYLDPMYYYTNRLTDKSDVYSFGVLVIELLTRNKPFIYRSNDGDSLVSHFSSLFTEGKLVDIVDPQVMEEENDDIQEVATLAVMCTKLKGEDRPTMREVEMTLENLWAKDRATNNTTPGCRDHVQAQRATQEVSRQYTMEEEIMLSARYPR